MPRHYKKDPSRRKTREINDHQLQQAVEAVAAGMTVRSAQAQFGISRSALHRYLKRSRLRPDEPIQVAKKGGPCWLPEDLERELVQTAVLCATQDNALTSMDLRCLVKSYLDREKLVIKKFKDNMPGYDWSQSFITRHGLTDLVVATRSKRRKEDTLGGVEPVECFVKVEMEDVDEDLS